MRRILAWLIPLIAALALAAWIASPVRQQLPAAAPAAAEVEATRQTKVQGPSDAPTPGASSVAEPRQAALVEPVAEARSAASPPYRLRVATRATIFESSGPVTHVPVEAGAGHPADPAAKVLARGTSDAEGRLELQLPRDEVDAAREAGERLWARPAGAGWKADARRITMQHCEGISTLVVQAQEGCTAWGRLLDERGAPVSGSIRAAPIVQSTGGMAHGGTEAGVDGWFELHLDPNEVVHVVADANDAGGAALRDFGPACTWPPEQVGLVVRGPGVVRGRVRDAAGAPAGQLELLVLPPQLDDGQGSLLLPEPQATVLALEGRGRTHAQVRTDEQGAFEVRGLTGDPLLIRARTAGGASYQHLLTPAPVRPDGIPLELRFGRPHLVVRAVDAQGETLAAHVNPRLRRRPWETWADQLHFTVTPIAEEASPLGNFRVPGKAGPAGTGFFEVEEGRSYHVGLLGPGQPLRPRTVHVPPGTGRVEVELRAEELPAGELVLSVADTSGAALEDGFVVRLSDPESDVPLLVRERFYRATWPLRISVPAGRYRLVVEGDELISRQHSSVVRRRAYGRFEAQVVILAGAETPLLAVLPQGARLRIRLSGEVLEQDRQGLLDPFRGTDTSQQLPEAALVLRAPSRWPTPIHFVESTSWGEMRTSELPLSSQKTSELLPAGRYMLEARMPGGRVATAPVVLVDGKTTEVTLTFE